MGPSLLSRSVAEAIGTFAIVFFGVGAVHANAIPGAGVGLVGVALAFGVTVAVMVSSLAHVSGAHLNPAVTVMLCARGRVGPGAAAAYVGAQIAGAVVASTVLREVAGRMVAIGHGATTLAPGVGPAGGVLIEAVLTFFLVLVIFGTAIDKRGHALGGVAIGAVVAAAVLVGGPLTGASMNPARSFGPALVDGVWAQHWVYWVGPIAGALAAAVVYEDLITRRR